LDAQPHPQLAGEGNAISGPAPGAAPALPCTGQPLVGPPVWSQSPLAVLCCHHDPWLVPPHPGRGGVEGRRSPGVARALTSSQESPWQSHPTSSVCPLWQPMGPSGKHHGVSTHHHMLYASKVSLSRPSQKEGDLEDTHMTVHRLLGSVGHCWGEH